MKKQEEANKPVLKVDSKRRRFVVSLPLYAEIEGEQVNRVRSKQIMGEFSQILADVCSNNIDLLWEQYRKKYWNPATREWIESAGLGGNTTVKIVTQENLTKDEYYAASLRTLKKKFESDPSLEFPKYGKIRVK